MDQGFITRFENLNKYKIDVADEVLRQRGRDFEDLINEVFASEEILLRKSYHTDDNSSEQIDGAIELYNRIFLLEMKWVASNLAASELYGFIGKIDNKFHGTLGIFISRNPLTENFIHALNKGRRQSVLVVHGNDLDLLFKSDAPTFTEYLTFIFKRLSYDNLAHFTVKDYMPIFTAEKAAIKPPSNSNEEAKKFIKDFLDQSQLVSDTHLLRETGFMDTETINEVFDFAVKNYRTIYFTSIRTQNFYTPSNYTNFIKIAKPDKEHLEQFSEKYFAEILPTDIMFYGTPAILSHFTPYYKHLNQGTKNNFESYLTSAYEKNFNTWDVENRLTEIVEDIWDDLSTQTRDEIMYYYVLFFINQTRLDKFAQKKFARKLFEEGKISKEYLSDWLDKRLRKTINSYEGVHKDDLVLTLAVVYKDLRPFLKVEDWKAYIKNKVEEIGFK